MYCYYQLAAVFAIDIVLGIFKPFPLGVCARLVFTAAAMFALTSPSRHYSYGLNDLLMAIAEEHATECKMSNKEKGKREAPQACCIWGVVQQEAEQTRLLICSYL